MMHQQRLIINGIKTGATSAASREKSARVAAQHQWRVSIRQQQNKLARLSKRWRRRAAAARIKQQKTRARHARSSKRGGM